MEHIGVIMGKMHSGGKKNLVMEYYRNINKKEIQFDFICDADSNAIPKDEIEALGGNVYIVPPYQNIFSNMSAIKTICKKNKYRIVHGYNGTMNLFCMYAAWCAGVPIRINESISMAHDADKKTILKKVLKLFSKCFSTHFVANGELCGKWQFGEALFNEGKVTVFKSVIDVSENVYSPMLRDRCRKELGLDNDIVVGHIGRLTEQKNTLFVIEIFNEIIKRENRAKLLIVGDGNLKDEMLKKIDSLNLQGAVVYLGRREDIRQFYNAMDCFLLPSLYEGLPIVGVEAQCCGLPVFFSSEISRESSPCNDLGFFIDLDKSPSYWAERVLETLKHHRRSDHSDSVRLAGFDSKQESGKLLDYYRGLISM